MEIKLLSSAHLILAKDDEGLYLCINGKWDVELDEKQFIKLLEIAEQAKQELGGLQ